MKTPELESLMGYYHEDFDLQGGIWGTLDFFLSHASAEELLDLVREINTVLATVTDDVELDKLLESLGSCVDLGTDLAAYRGWLEEIARRVTAEF